MTEDGRALAFPTMFYPTSTTAAKAPGHHLTSGEETNRDRLSAQARADIEGVGNDDGPGGSRRQSSDHDDSCRSRRTGVTHRHTVELLGWAGPASRSTACRQDSTSFARPELRAWRWARCETTTIQQGGNVMVFRTATASGSAPLPTESDALGGDDGLGRQPRRVGLTIGLRPGLKVNGMVQFNGTSRAAGQAIACRRSH